MTSQEDGLSRTGSVTYSSSRYAFEPGSSDLTWFKVAGFPLEACVNDEWLKLMGIQVKKTPSDIEVDETSYAISLAVAGFSREDLDIQVEKGVLTVRGNKRSKDEGKYLYQGITNRTIERKFNLGDYVEVTGADHF